ncbi:MAG: CBS domain-containing protein [Anaerolineales bacterium]|jgi:CBS domain-containing protein|uniref:CBS domain-containing protein n=1 Tax=Candidatus Villigracilis affinis TaxID=3140682 RepID=UPI001B53CE1B|nr:CBS domain-containing protein [Anaerolineales bacterium]MBK9601389.1 CBS domain-containing protein [Anaerolineales bacterium]MBL0344934.1 CBS domain-containing protein [Anaerolineales bacterium]MBP8047482.1 CBS domain-containing protein [Anaerolineales bacterium]
MTTVRKLVDEKAETKIHTIQADATVLDALQIMAEADTGAVLVTENDKIIGIFTERDYAREGEVKGIYAKDTIVRDVMTSQMVMIRPETTLQECAELMRQYRVRHLPVLENERVIGIVSIRGLAEALLQQKQGTIVELEKYILGTGYGE